MKALRYILFFVIIILYFTVSGQEKVDTIIKVKKIQYGISAGLLSNSWFYNDKSRTQYKFWNKNLPLDLDIVAFYHLKKKYYITSNLSFVSKSSISKGGVSYSFDYITFASMISRKFKYWKKGDFVLSIGPYVGYLLSAEKGRNTIKDEELKKWEFGIEFLHSTKTQGNYVPANFSTMKFQLGLTEILYFKTLTFTISFFG